MNLLASVSVTSSQKGAEKMRKKRKPKRFWTRPGRTGKWWQNFLDNVVILEESLPLAMIFNSSMESGIFPDNWKLAKVTPIFKSGHKSDPFNYRPISIISVFAKIFERIIHDQLYDFLKENSILMPNQSAFRKLHSTTTSFIDCTYYWYENIDKKQKNLSMLLYLRKAFDTVDHKIMFMKLNVIGINGITGDWFSSYLRNRKQYCSLGNQASYKA